MKLSATAQFRVHHVKWWWGAMGNVVEWGGVDEVVVVVGLCICKCKVGGRFPKIIKIIICVLYIHQK
jgi:hypothetical protein